MGAHPRAGGENLHQARRDPSGWGSSPRWRGKQKEVNRSGRAERLIPALAGKTRQRRRAARLSTAHPRAGGENHRAPRRGRRGAGSSPRWRGKLKHDTTISRLQRLIPALAGKTLVLRPFTADRPAHPRAGGENSGVFWNVKRRSGSSPRWRGKRARLRRSRIRVRLIPALAGKTSDRQGSRPGLRAHPRAGGENLCAPIGYVPVSGSSPRWRGKRSTGHGQDIDAGLIPALAGKTSLHDLARAAREAHPRAGGENLRLRCGHQGA